ncbi:MAG: NAD(P)/FAD-dependent oxidoreductase [Planctomycetota bacterium]
MEQYQTIIIGGGAAGLMAAITSARQGHQTLIIEKNQIIGRKILVTGNGRCNLTNTHITPDKYYGENTKCLHNIFSRFSSKDTIAFFEDIGVRLKTEEEGRVFPVTNQASTIVDLLTEELTQLKVSINLCECVKELISIKDGWEVRTTKTIYYSKNVILATGGKSYPQLGSTGDGFDLAHRLGHRIIEPRPALVSLEIAGNPPECTYGRAGWFHKLQGVKSEVEMTLRCYDTPRCESGRSVSKGIGAERPASAPMLTNGASRTKHRDEGIGTLTNSGKTIARETGELLFTHYGISGPIVLNLSRLIMDYSNKSDSAVFINFFPGYTPDKLKQFITDRWKAHPQKTLANSLIGLLPKKLCGVLIGELKLIGETKVNQITKNDLNSIAEKFTHWLITVKKSRPFDESMITAGGVAMDDVNTRTMESLKKKGLYLAGEVLDIDGVSGGYNLQFAWSTGYLAGLQL